MTHTTSRCSENHIRPTHPTWKPKRNVTSIHKKTKEQKYKTSAKRNVRIIPRIAKCQFFLLVYAYIVSTLASSIFRMSERIPLTPWYISHEKLKSIPSRFYGSIVLSHSSSFYPPLDPFLSSSIKRTPSHFKGSCNNILQSTSWSSEISLLFKFQAKLFTAVSPPPCVLHACSARVDCLILMTCGEKQIYKF